MFESLQASKQSLDAAAFVWAGQDEESVVSLAAATLLLEQVRFTDEQ